MSKLGTKNSQLFDTAANLMDDEFDEVDANFFNNNTSLVNAEQRVLELSRMSNLGLSEHDDALA
jgi:hypothetical protein